MTDRAFLKAGHPPTLLAAFLCFDMAFMVWVLLGPLGVQIAAELHLDAAQKGLMVAVPILSGALLRVVTGLLVSFRPPQAWMVLVLFVCGMLAHGMGNGSVFQLVPRRFRREIGVMTGIIGMTGGLGGFYLASSLGFSRQLTGSYQMGLLIFALLAVLALGGQTRIKNRWRTTWGAALGMARI